MRVGISIGTTFREDDPRYGPRLVLDQARAAREAGLDTLSVGDHHATGPIGYLQNVPMLARLLAEWNARPAGCLFLVPLWHPVLMAEQIGTLAAMASGPFIVQTGVGAGAEQFEAMGEQLSRRGRRMEEGVKVVQQLLAGDSVTSEFFGITDARIAPLPPDATEWWMGGFAPAALDRAARLGDCWYGGPELTPESAQRTLDSYLEACTRHGRTAGRLPIRRDVYIADSHEEAVEHGDRLMAAGYRSLDRSAVIYGGVEAVGEEFSRLGQYGFSDVIIRVMPAPAPETIRSVELAGEVRAALAPGMSQD